MNLAHQVRKTILELASEDAHGSWELWGAVQQDALQGTESLDTLKKVFLEEIEVLIKEKKMVSFHHEESTNLYKEVPLDISRLWFELEHAKNPQTDAYYWFGASETGKEEDRRLRSQ